MGRLSRVWVASAWGAAVLSVPSVAVAQLPGPGELGRIGFALGPSDAPVTVIEYADFACSACAEFARDTWPAVRDEFVETGKVRWWLVPFDFGFRNSEEGGRAADCAAAQGGLWEMHDLLFLQREGWTNERGPEDLLVGLARDAGLDEERFRRCYHDGGDEDRVEAATRSARAVGLRGTPTFFVDGRPIQGAVPIEIFRQLLEGSGRRHEP